MGIYSYVKNEGKIKHVGRIRNLFGLYIILILVILFQYVWPAFCLMTIAERTGTPHSWMAWIPLLNIYLFCKIAGHSGFWVLAILLIPLLNIIIAIWFWVDIAKRRSKSEIYGILMIIPIINLIIIGILASSER